MSALHDVDDLGEPPPILPPPFDNPWLDLVLAIALILLAIGSGLKRRVAPEPAPAPAPTIRLRPPQFATLSASDEAAAAHLLGSSLAELWTAGGEPAP